MVNIAYFLFNVLFVNAMATLFINAMANQNSSQQPIQITVWEHTLNSPEKIIMALLINSLEVTRKQYGDYEINVSPEMEQKRALQQLLIDDGATIDVGHFAATKQRESQGIPIYIPLIKGLLGYRICLIKDIHQDKFTSIENKQQLIDSSLSIGQHKDWPDTEILRSNNLIVNTTYKRHLLFQQLDNHRFHCFSRGVNEISFEYAEHLDKDIQIEKSLLIYYPFPMFFFVNSNKPQLAERIRIGLTQLQKSGQADKLFEQYYRDKLSNLNLESRKIIKLDNPTISEKSRQIMLKQSPPF